MSSETHPTTSPPSTTQPPLTQRGDGRPVSLPVTREEHFIGRDDDLRHLRVALEGADPSGRVQVLHGLGGVGKTQLANEFAHRNAGRYAAAWWLPAADPAALALAYAALGKAVGCRLAGDATVDYVRHVTRRRLGELGSEGKLPYLLVFDNAEDPKAIRDYLPKDGDGRLVGHVLVTTRNADFGQLGKPFAVRVLGREGAVALLRAASGRQQDDGADELAKALGDLPLALVQAAAVCREAALSFAQYTRRFETHWAELLGKGAADTSHPSSLAMTLEFGFKQVEEEHPLAADLLTLGAFFHGDGVTRQLLAEADAAGVLPQPLGSRCSDPVTFGELGKGLRRFSLADASGEGLSMHRLVGALARRRLPAEERARWAAMAASAAKETFDYDGHDVSGWKRCAGRVRQLVATCTYADEAHVVPKVAADGFDAAGRFLLKMGRLDEARAVLEKALAIVTNHEGVGSGRHAAVSNDLGRVLQAQGDAEAALRQFENALKIDQEKHGEDSPKQVAAANNYAKQLQMLGRTGEAIGHFRWVARTLEDRHPDGHPKLAAALNNLGHVMLEEGELDKAEQHLGRAWQMIDATCGEDDPVRATVLRNYANLYFRRGDKAAARDYATQARDLLSAAYGDNAHPEVAEAAAFLQRIG